MKLKAYQKNIWIIELSSIYLLGLKGAFLLHTDSASECTLGCISCGAINEGLFTKKYFTRT